MSKVILTIAMAMTAVASAAVATGITASLTDASGNVQNVAVSASAFPTPDSNGKFEVDVTFDSVGSGDFTGSVTAQTSTGETVGTPVTFSGSASNLQPVPVSVTVTMG